MKNNNLLKLHPKILFEISHTTEPYSTLLVKVIYKNNGYEEILEIGEKATEQIYECLKNHYEKRRLN